MKHLQGIRRAGAANSIPVIDDGAPLKRDVAHGLLEGVTAIPVIDDGAPLKLASLPFNFATLVDDPRHR